MKHAIGAHLLSLNLFREADGSLHITVSGHSPQFMLDYVNSEAGSKHKIPADFANELIREAIKNLS